jgi:diguanylate cyclase (GGDEF)-like protein
VWQVVAGLVRSKEVLQSWLPGALALGGICLSRLWSEPLLLALAELVSIALLFAVFMFAWNARAFLDSDYFLVLGIACLSLAILEGLHMFSHPWFSLVPGGIETSARALLAGRYLQGVSFLVALAFVQRKLRPIPTLLSFLGVAAALVAAILLVSRPSCYTPDGNATLFYFASHWFTAGLVLAALALLHHSGHRFHPRVLALVSAAIAVTALASVAFSLTQLLSGPWQALGQLLLAMSSYLIYKAFVETGFTRPFDSLFHNLTEAEARMRDISLRDDLTGLYNRRGFFSLAEQQTKLSQRTGRNMLLFYCDLNAMKSINDTLGHHEGDRALTDVAAILSETFRESDIIARIGGDEFAVLAIESDDTSVGMLRMRLERNLIAFADSAGRPYDISLSIGVATYDPLLSESLDQVLSRADDLMYRQKQARRRNGKEHLNT